MKNAPVINLIEQTILDQMRSKASFTALDISNRLKTDRYPVQHREVAAIVREVYASGAMAHYDYDRALIPVVTEGGAKQTKAFLYHFQEVRPRTYQTRDLRALPPVAPDQARDLSDCAAAAPLPLLPRPAQARTASPCRSYIRRDGALSIPRRLLRQLGWKDGFLLTLVGEADQFLLQPVSAGQAGDTLRVWNGLRLRICRTKLRGLSVGSVAITLFEGKIICKQK